MFFASAGFARDRKGITAILSIVSTDSLGANLSLPCMLRILQATDVLTHLMLKFLFQQGVENMVYIMIIKPLGLAQYPFTLKS